MGIHPAGCVWVLAAGGWLLGGCAGPSTQPRGTEPVAVVSLSPSTGSLVPAEALQLDAVRRDLFGNPLPTVPSPGPPQTPPSRPSHPPDW